MFPRKVKRWQSKGVWGHAGDAGKLFLKTYNYLQFLASRISILATHQYFEVVIMVVSNLWHTQQVSGMSAGMLLKCVFAWRSLYKFLARKIMIH